MAEFKAASRRSFWLWISILANLLLCCNICPAYVSQEGASAVVWCAPDNEKVIYNLDAQVFCNSSQLVTLVVPTKDFKAFSDALCTAMMYKSAKIKFRHIGNFLYGDPKSRSRAAANLAYTLLKWSLMNLSPRASDLFLEFGVANGNSINMTAVLRARLTQSPPHPVYGFDSFWGLPVNWTTKAGYERGAFSRNGSQPQVEVGVQLVQGLVEVTLPVFLAEHPGEYVSFVNLDLDLFDGVLGVLRLLLPRFRPGTLLHFHELFYQPLGERKLYGDEEMKALHQLMLESKLKLQLLPFRDNHGESAVFRVLAV